MPRSRVRRKNAYTPPPTSGSVVVRKRRRSTAWVGPAMLVFFLLGIIWLSAYYISGGDMILLRDLGAWNLAIGFAFVLVGFGLATQWR